MIQHDRHDAILVKIISVNDDGKEEMVSSYHTTAIDQTLKVFITARDYDIEVSFNELNTEINEKYTCMTHYIKDIYLGLGSHTDIPVIEVYI